MTIPINNSLFPFPSKLVESRLISLRFYSQQRKYKIRANDTAFISLRSTTANTFIRRQVNRQTDCFFSFWTKVNQRQSKMDCNEVSSFYFIFSIKRTNTNTKISFFSLFSGNQWERHFPYITSMDWWGLDRLYQKNESSKLLRCFG